MTRTFKKCLYCEGRLYAKKLCKYHYYKQLRKQTKQKKHYKPIKKFSQAGIRKTKLYKKAREAFFSNDVNHICKVGAPGVCTIHATDVHHMAGRIGELLTNQTYFLAVCRGCHRYLHDHSEWAQEHGFIIHLN